MPMNGYPYPGQPAPYQYPNPWTPQPTPPPQPQMPMAPAMPQLAPPPPMPQMPAAPAGPPVPKVGQLPPRANTNATGGPAQGAQSALRSGVHTQLYRLGKRMDGKTNMFGQFDPNMVPQEDPLAWMQPPPVEEPRVMPALPPAPTGPTPDQYPIHLRPPQQTPPRPIDRFPGLAARMGRPMLPPPNGRRY